MGFIMLILKTRNLRLSVWLNSYQEHTTITWQNLGWNWTLSDFNSSVPIHCDFFTTTLPLPTIESLFSYFLFKITFTMKHFLPMAVTMILKILKNWYALGVDQWAQMPGMVSAGKGPKGRWNARGGPFSCHVLRTEGFLEGSRAHGGSWQLLFTSCYIHLLNFS